MYHLSDRFQKITICVNALYDARQHGDLASAFSKVQEREIANSKTAFCKNSFCILRIPISAFAKSENERSHIRDHTLCKFQTQPASNSAFGGFELTEYENEGLCCNEN